MSTSTRRICNESDGCTMGVAVSPSPGSPLALGGPGRSAVQSVRLVINGLLYRAKTGCPNGGGCRRRFGCWKTAIWLLQSVAATRALGSDFGRADPTGSNRSRPPPQAVGGQR